MNTTGNITPLDGERPSGEHIHHWHGKVTQEVCTTEHGETTTVFPDKPVVHFVDHMGLDGTTLTLWSGQSASEAQIKALLCGIQWGLPVYHE